MRYGFEWGNQRLFNACCLASAFTEASVYRPPFCLLRFATDDAAGPALERWSRSSFLRQPRIYKLQFFILYFISFSLCVYAIGNLASLVCRLSLKLNFLARWPIGAMANRQT